MDSFPWGEVLRFKNQFQHWLDKCSKWGTTTSHHLSVPGIGLA